MDLMPAMHQGRARSVARKAMVSMGFEADDVSKCCAILRFFKNCGVLDSMQGHFVLA